MEIVRFLALAAIAAMLFGCASTKSVITEYDSAGNITKTTETSKSVVSEITESTKGKTVIAWESGWAAYLAASTATQQDPTPTVKMFAGKTDKGIISAMPEQKNWDGIASAIRATKYEIKIGKDGFENTGEQNTEKASDEKKSPDM